MANDHKMYQKFRFQGLPKYAKIGINRMQIYHPSFHYVVLKYVVPKLRFWKYSVGIRESSIVKNQQYFE
jgi:hypothetical protein